jgi:hypothetical protein
MNLPGYKPAPPFLLASLVGEAASAGGASFDAHVNLPPEGTIEENVMKSGPRYEDAYEDMEINLDHEHAEKARESRFKLPGLAEAVAEMDSEPLQIDENATGAEEFILDEGAVEYAGEREGSSEPEIEFDPESYRQAVEDEFGKNKTLKPNELEFEGISFDPAAMGLQPDSRKEEELVFTPDDLDFELLENDDDEKRS